MTEDHSRASRDSPEAESDPCSSEVEPDLRSTGAESNLRSSEVEFDPDSTDSPSDEPTPPDADSSDAIPNGLASDALVPVSRTERVPSPILRTLLEDCSEGRALDVATGLGRNAIALAEAGLRVDALDVSRAQLERARERAVSRSVSIEWILADVDSYVFLEETYDVVTIGFFDARDRLPGILSALSPGGLLFYEHYLESADGNGPGDRYRFASNELLAACANLTVLYYAEYRVDGEPRVTLVAYKPSDESTRAVANSES
ncbi:class I SAM-dependent methyltransferase [Natrarchaeobius sp. A-rgal3]|uniref:class I SAM-dependent methyltransferase n=1 Tax=Natrarchaeobius versutus TaxID=1679078 RepID=UPI0035103959